MGLGIWVHVGWFQLPRKKGEGSERERRAWAGGGGDRAQHPFFLPRGHAGIVAA